MRVWLAFLGVILPTLAWAQTTGGLLNYDAHNGAAPLPLAICQNGTCTESGGGGTTGPAGPAGLDSGCLNIVKFGGAGDNSTDNGPALLAAINAQPPGQACVAFPAGKFKFASPFSYTYPSVFLAGLSLRGAGINVTQLIGPANGSLFSFTFSQQFDAIHLSDMSLITNNPCSSCTALALTMAATITAAGYSGQSDITNVVISGSDPSDNVPSGSNYWETAIDDFGVSNINFSGVYIEGIQTSSTVTPGTSRGVYIHGDATHVPVVANFVNSSVNLYSRGVEIGAYTQGVTWVNSNLTGNLYGFYVSNPSGDAGGQLSVSNSSGTNCSNLTIAPGALMSFVQVSNSYWGSYAQPYPCGSVKTSIDLEQGGPYAIVSGNTFGSSSASAGFRAVAIGGASYAGGKAVNNIINGFATGVDTTVATGSPTGMSIIGNTITNSGNAIVLGANTFDTVVSNNILQGNTNDLQNNTGNVYENFVDIPQDCSNPALGTVGLTFGGANTGITYSNFTCKVAVVNREMFVDFDLTLSSKGTATGQAAYQMANPATSVAPGGTVSLAFAGSMAGLTGAITGTVDVSASQVLFWQWTAVGVSSLTDANFTGTSKIRGRASLRTPSVAP